MMVILKCRKTGSTAISPLGAIQAWIWQPSMARDGLPSHSDDGAAVGMTTFTLIGIILAQGSEYTLHWCMAKLNAVPHITKTLQQHVICAIYSLGNRSTSTTPTHSKQYHTTFMKWQQSLIYPNYNMLVNDMFEQWENTIWWTRPPQYIYSFVKLSLPIYYSWVWDSLASLQIPLLLKLGDTYMCYRTGPSLV